MGCFGLLFFLSTLLILFGLNTAQPSYLYHFCLGGNYTTNSTFGSNLNLLLSSLSSNNATFDTGFYNTTAGRIPDTVYGSFLCRGDFSSEVCRICVEKATEEITQRCPNKKESIIWYDECMLRYSNQSFFSIMQDSPSLYMWNRNNNSNPDQFYEEAVVLMNNLVNQAAFDSSSAMFATGETNFTSFQNIYGLVQCTPDISRSECNNCLRLSVLQIDACCDKKVGGRVIRPSCNFRYEIYSFYQSNETEQAPSTPTPSLPPSSTNGNKNNTRIVTAVVIPVVSALVLASAICSFLLWRKAMRKKDGYRENMQENPLVHLDESDQGVNDLSDTYKHRKDQSEGIDIPVFDFESMLAATENFSNSNKLGQGGFGPVYRGKLPGGQEIAVKRLSRSSGQGLEEFKNEVLLIAKLQHRNLVRLLGYCTKGDEKMLLYEYMPNKSLDFFIFDRTLCLLLNWEKRFNIILGIARGILYLHQDSRLRIIHRDLKASNILLDEEMNPKISDFGMARIFGGSQTQANTNRVVGTYGYMSPEYALDGLFSIKSDVFSFGVILLEIISGKRNSGFHQSEESLSLIGHAWRLWNEDKPLDLIDSSLCEACNTLEVLKCIHVGLLCVQDDASDRPTMSNVVFMLGSETATLPTPKQPIFVLRRSLSSTGSTSKPKICSNMEITVIEEGR